MWKSDVKHLSAESRNRLLRQLTVEEAAMAILNTLALNRDLWNKMHAGDGFDHTISGLVKFIKGDIDREQFVDANNRWRVHYENRIHEGEYRIGYAGMAIVKLGQECLSGNFAVPDELEEHSDPENWSSLFFGSLAFSKGAEDIGKLDPEKNGSYWNSFLENITNKNFTCRQPAGSNRVDDRDIHSILVGRKQVEFFNSHSTADGLPGRLRGKAVLIKEKYGARSLFLEFVLINNSFSFSLLCDDQPIDHKEAYLLNIRLGLKPLITSIKKEMYGARPEEGAWLSSGFVFNEDDTLTADFNYDAKKGIFDKFLDITDYKEELTAYPREQRFIPKWLNEIVNG